jgi:hypothetical protein
MLSAADPETETVPETVLPGAGAAMATDGGLVSGGGVVGVGVLLNVTVLVVTAVLPELSVAFAAIVCVPSGYDAELRGKLHEVVPVARWYVPPSTLTCTLATEVPLSEAEPETLTGPDTVEPDEGEAIEMVGVEEVPLGLPPPLPPPGAAAAPAANRRRRRSPSITGRWWSRPWSDRTRRESMRRSL